MKNFRKVVIAYLFAVMVLSATSRTAVADVKVVAVMAIQLLSTDMETDNQQLADMFMVEYSAKVREDPDQRLSVQINIRPVTAYLL